ncbi:MAG: two component transcriptional regulator, winged helix family [Clostridia bacterium]|nr:two component transcriptional regulator, winged helix family [Clostridia bacterium]
MKNVLIVDDDPITLKILCAAIEKRGFAVIKATNGNDALLKLQKHEVCAIILDLNLPDINGLEILKQIRNHPILNAIAVIIVTENDDKLEAILGLEMGADDYITKPFHQRELIARLNTILRRTQHINTNMHSHLIFNDLHIDLKKRIVKKQDIDINLTFKEFEILALLAANPGEVLPREAIMNAIGGLDYSPETRTIDMHIAAIRKKLDDTDKEKVYIDTVSGVGYRFRK